MKTLKFMLAAATAIGLASATQADQYNTTGFEKLPLGTNVTTGVQDNRSGYSYFYYAGANAEDNESVIAAGTPDVARPNGAAAVDEGRSQILQVSTGTDPLMRTYKPLSGGNPQAATTLAGDTYVDTLVQFTVTPYTDTVTPGENDKLMIYLKESVVTNEFGEITSASTNLVVIGGYMVEDGVFETKEYKVTGVDIEPNTWHRLTVKVIANYGALDGYHHPAFLIYLDGVSDPCVLDDLAIAEDNGSSTGYVAPFDDDSLTLTELDEKNLVFSLKCNSQTAATLQGVGFAGEGKVDDIVFTDVDPFFTAVDFTFAGVSGVTATQTPGTDNWTFTAPEGTVIKSFLVNGNPVAAAVGATSYQWTAASGDAGALVVVAAGKQLTAAEHPWYESPKGFVLAENLPGQSPQIVSSFHGQGQEEYLGNTYSTSPMQFDLYKVDGTNALDGVYQVLAADVTTPGFRGVAISKALGIAMTLAYAKTTTKYAYPLTPNGEPPIAVTKLGTHAFDAGAFSPDGRYFFSNNIEGESSKNYYVKWSVAMTTNSLTLTKVDSIDAGGRGRNMAYARINGRDLVFGLVDDSKVVVMDMTGDDVSAWSATDLITDLPAHSYGSLCVSGVNATGATPKLTVAASMNGADVHTDVLNVYTLTVPSSGAVTASLTTSFDEAALTAAFFGDISDANRYGNTVYVTDDDATIYFGRGDNKLYAGIYVPKYDITFISGEGSTTNELSVYEGDTPVAPTAAEVAGKTFTAWGPTIVAAAADATYTATYDWTTYTITYLNADETTFTDFMDGYTAPATFTAETPVTLPVAANIDLSVVGVMFDSWTNAAGTAVATTEGLYDNLVVFAKLEPVVAPPSGEELEPGEQSSTTYDSQAAAEAALANVTITASDAVTNALDSAAQATYLANFEAKVVSAGEGQYKVEVGLTAAATTALQAEVDADAAEVIEDLDTATVTLTTTPGFYYSFMYGTTLDNMTEVGTRTLATSATLELTRPTSVGAASGFYKVLVNVAPAAVTP